MFVVINSCCLIFVKRLSSKIIVSGFTHIYLRVVLIRMVFGSHFFSVIICERVYWDQILMIVIGLLHHSKNLGYGFFFRI